MLTKRMQQDILAQLLRGEPVEQKRITEFDEPWRTVYTAIANVAPEQRNAALFDAVSGQPFAGEVSVALGKVADMQRLGYRSLAEVADQIPPVRWLWNRWVPLGMITLMAAAGGTGKSMICLDLCRRVMTVGESWPDNTTILRHGPVIYIDAEAVPSLHNDRARDWDMDTSRLYFMPDPLNASLETVNLSSDEWRDRLIEMTHVINPSLVVVDSLGDINEKGENNVEDVRDLMAWFGRYVLDFQVGLVVIHHIKKRGGTAIFDLLTQDDVRGSGHIVNKARSVIGLSKIKGETDDQTESNWRRMEIIKTNLCAPPRPIGIEFLPGLHETPTLRYGDAPVSPREQTESDHCTEWLIDLLGGGPMKPAEIIDAGKDEGYGRTTIFKARKALGKRIVNTIGYKSPDNCWELSRL